MEGCTNALRYDTIRRIDIVEIILGDDIRDNRISALGNNNDNSSVNMEEGELIDIKSLAPI